MKRSTSGNSPYRNNPEYNSRRSSGVGKPTALMQAVKARLDALEEESGSSQTDISVLQSEVSANEENIQINEDILNSILNNNYIIVDESFTGTSDNITTSLQTAMETARDYYVANTAIMPIFIKDISSGNQSVDITFTAEAKLNLFSMVNNEDITDPPVIDGFIVRRGAFGVQLSIIDLISKLPHYIGAPRPRNFTIYDFEDNSSSTSYISINTYRINFKKNNTSYGMNFIHSTNNPTSVFHMEDGVIEDFNYPSADSANPAGMYLTNVSLYGDISLSSRHVCYWRKMRLDLGALKVPRSLFPGFYYGIYLEELLFCEITSIDRTTPAITGSIGCEGQGYYLLYRNTDSISNTTIDIFEENATIGIEQLSTLPGAGLFEGHTVYALDTHIVSTWNGTAWKPHYA